MILQNGQCINICPLLTPSCCIYFYWIEPKWVHGYMSKFVSWGTCLSQGNNSFCWQNTFVYTWCHYLEKKKKGSFSVNVKHYEYIPMLAIYITAINFKIFLDTSAWNGFETLSCSVLKHELYITCMFMIWKISNA